MPRKKAKKIKKRKLRGPDFIGITPQPKSKYPTKIS